MKIAFLTIMSAATWLSACLLEERLKPWISIGLFVIAIVCIVVSYVSFRNYDRTTTKYRKRESCNEMRLK